MYTKYSHSRVACVAKGQFTWGPISVGSYPIKKLAHGY